MVPQFRDETDGDIKTPGYKVRGHIVWGLNVQGYNVRGRIVPVPSPCLDSLDDLLVRRPVQAARPCFKLPDPAVDRLALSKSAFCLFDSGWSYEGPFENSLADSCLLLLLIYCTSRYFVCCSLIYFLFLFLYFYI
jgi:hypothetical protein